LSFDCRTCGSTQKELYGCEKDASDPVLTIQCVKCGGKNKDCEICHGSGTEDIYRCPLRKVETLREFIKFYGFYKKGFLPEEGGVLEQANIFLEACSFLDNEVAKIKNEKIKRMSKNGRR